MFLPAWPETYSYTLSELVKHGFIPLAPDIGAPADRIRSVKFGVVFPFPADAERLLALIDDIATGRVEPVAKGAAPANFFSRREDLDKLSRIILGTGSAASAGSKKKAKRAVPATA